MSKRILVLNLGSTSTKIAIFEDTVPLIKESIPHNVEVIKQFKHTMDQTDFRKEVLLNFLERKNICIQDFDCIIARGGNCKPLSSGIYEICGEMLDDIKSEKTGVHPAGIGCNVAYELGKKYNIPAIIADPPINDEFINLARYSGIKEIERISSFHATNHKAISRRYCQMVNKRYEDLNLIIVHLGGGISVVSHCKGKMIDGNNALDGDGPFSAERAGSLPVGDLIKMCYSGRYNMQEMLKKVTGNGGLVSYLGTSSGLEVEDMIKNGNEYALEVYEAMAYQVAKEIGSAAAVLKGDVDAIIFTGSMAYSKLFTGFIKERIKWIAEVVDMPGEDEMQSLAESAFRFLTGEERVKLY
ncbi:MAG: butyrate kinase [Sedimentibacter sp.]